MAYKVIHFVNPLNFQTLAEVPTMADAIHECGKAVADYFGAREYTSIAHDDSEDDGYDVFAYSGVDAIQLAVNRVA